MAKVKNQVTDNAEATYTDADGEVHYLGELFRHLTPNAYPLPSTPSMDVVRKSPRGYKPTQQGAGSAKQTPWRQCFQQCADRWNNMSDEDPEIGVCPEETSKARVWAAKLAQGVMCSYFDLYMACCLSFCSSITITGPGGITVKGGTIPANENCWPNPSPCRDSALSIGFTSQQMQVNGTQALIAHDSIYGDEVPCCPTGDLSWEITEGAGELDMDSGQSINYTAPEDNPDCANNPTIKVTDCCGREATLKIAVNANPGNFPLWEFDHTVADNCLQMGSSPPCYGSVDTWHKKMFSCSGPLQEIVESETCLRDCSGAYDPLDTCSTNAVLCDYDFFDTDGRTPEQIANGCCPAQLL